MRVLIPPGTTIPVFNHNPQLHLIDCVIWTDGHYFNPYMTRRVTGLMLRPSDGFLFWECDAEDLGDTEAKQPYIAWINLPAPIECVWPLEWKDLEIVEHASEEDYFHALSSGLTAQRERELSVRSELYRVWNHPVRYGEYRKDSLRHEENASALLSMLSTKDPDEALMKAEILRNTYRFDESLDALQGLNLSENNYHERRAAKIRELAEQDIPDVAVYDGKIAEPRPVYGFSNKLRGF